MLVQTVLALYNMTFIPEQDSHSGKGNAVYV